MDQFSSIFNQLLGGEEISLNLLIILMPFAAYFLQGIALSAIAKRRQIKNSWLAWIPVVNVWILGSISDQYQYVVNAQVKNKRKALLGLNIAATVLAAGLAVVLVVSGLIHLDLDFSSGDNALKGMASTAYSIPALSVLMWVLIGVLGVPLIGVTVFYNICFYKALYDVFRSCNPQKTALYFTLSLTTGFVVEGLYALFLLLCKNKELGMPPRKGGEKQTPQPAPVYAPMPPQPPIQGYAPMPPQPPVQGYAPMPPQPPVQGYAPMPPQPPVQGYAPMPPQPPVRGYAPMPPQPPVQGYAPTPVQEPIPMAAPEAPAATEE